MPLYFLEYNHAEKRQMITETPNWDGQHPEAQVEASSWIEAKSRLGFDLTPLQSFMLSTKEAT